MEPVLLRDTKQIVGEKRQNIPYTLTYNCTCGFKNYINLAEETYLSYPKFGGTPKPVFDLCENCAEEHTFFIRVDIVAKLVEENQNET